MAMLTENRRMQYRRTTTYEPSRNNKLEFMNMARTNKLLFPIYLTNREPRVYEYFNKLTLTNLTIYLIKINSSCEHSTYKHISKNTLCSQVGIRLQSEYPIENVTEIGNEKFSKCPAPLKLSGPPVDVAKLYDFDVASAASMAVVIISRSGLLFRLEESQRRTGMMGRQTNIRSGS
jgi:hypothetical protein